VWSSPAVADGKVFVGSYDGKVYCLNASDGALIWNYTTGDVFSSPAVVDGKVYVGSYDGKVYCLDASDGTPIWNYTIGLFVISSPAVVDGKVYVGSSLGLSDGKVYCLDASDGTPIWNYTTGNMVWSSPAVVDGKVYVGSHDGKVYCLNASAASMTPDEREIWNYTTGVGTSSPAVADGKVYVGSWDNKTYCLDASDGTPIWNYTTGGSVGSSPAVADGMVFIGSSDGKVYAFGHVVRVPEDYPTIQEAIDAACTIIVAPGTYYENLVINKSLTIIGKKGSNGPIFDGTITGTLVTITDTSKVTITNIIMTNYEKAILIENSSDCTIYNNIMYNMDYSGTAIESDNAANNLIYNNILQDNNIAIDLTESSTSNIIYANTISGNEIGIDMSNSNENIIYHNNFVDNNFQAISNPSSNTWDNGAEGNYWSDYEDRYPNATELDGSGIWDTPYEINENNVDRYPLMRPFSGIGITNVTTSKTIIGQGFTLSIDLTILNYGINDEDSTVTVYANTKRIAMRTITLTNRNSTTITFTWNTAGVPCGNYTITAKADPVPYERETTDNTRTCWVKVTVVGDVNGDYRASVADMVEVDIALGTKPGEPNYNPNADVNCDGSISVADMVVIDIHLGEEC